jgi:hypothetical protein
MKEAGVLISAGPLAFGTLFQYLSTFGSTSVLPNGAHSTFGATLS